MVTGRLAWATPIEGVAKASPAARRPRRSMFILRGMFLPPQVYDLLDTLVRSGRRRDTSSLKRSRAFNP
jgi:hypothetical protein